MYDTNHGHLVSCDTFSFSFGLQELWSCQYEVEAPVPSPSKMWTPERLMHTLTLGVVGSRIQSISLQNSFPTLSAPQPGFILRQDQNVLVRILGAICRYEYKHLVSHIQMLNPPARFVKAFSEIHQSLSITLFSYQLFPLLSYIPTATATHPSSFNMSARYVAGTTIKTIQHAGREIVLEFVSETTEWKRTFIDKSVLDDFAATAEKSLDTLRADTAYVAMKEKEHDSKSDRRSHFSVLELDKSKNVMASRHLVKK
ncbi:hypothetical protein BDFG_02067 [Blastomyces dermatitidis ATCC 26199]|nr:hypothetical protein BDFG_02067 [Blastomyces dermatitidis ATCC 26199]